MDAEEKKLIRDLTLRIEFLAKQLQRIGQVLEKIEPTLTETVAKAPPRPRKR